MVAQHNQGISKDDINLKDKKYFNIDYDLIKNNENAKKEVKDIIGKLGKGCTIYFYSKTDTTIIAKEINNKIKDLDLNDKKVIFANSYENKKCIFQKERGNKEFENSDRVNNVRDFRVHFLKTQPSEKRIFQNLPAYLNKLEKYQATDAKKDIGSKEFNNYFADFNPDNNKTLIFAKPSLKVNIINATAIKLFSIDSSNNLGG
jgi:hypothetical protein